MKQVLFSALAIASLHIAAFSVTPARAQTRVFVAAQGSDANPCSFAQPCRTFQHAHDVVAANGEIDVLDPAGYGAINIIKSISIQGHGFAGLAVPSGDGITINVGATDKVNLRGLLIDGVATGGDGIVFNSGASLNVQDCLIRNFGAFNQSRGIVFQPSATASLFVSDTLLADNKGPGIALHPTGAAGAVTGVLERVQIHNSGAVGLAIAGISLTSGRLTVTISDSVVANSVSHGIHARTNTTPTAVMVRSSRIANNGGDGVLSDGSATTVRVTQSTITGNSTGWAAITSGMLLSYGDNNVDGNTTEGVPTSAIVTH